MPRRRSQICILELTATALLAGALASCAARVREPSPPAKAPSEIEAAPLPPLPAAIPSHPNAPLPWQYLYNRNALLDSVRVGAYRVALAEAGHLLVFDHSFHLVDELLLHTAATCIAPDSDAGVLVGYENGRIERVMIPTLQRHVLAHVPGRVAWVGASPKSTQLVAVFASVGAHADASFRPRYTVRALDSGVDTSVLEANAFLLDAGGQLWLGAKHGEWGGTLQCAQPNTGQVRNVEMPGHSGINGFAEVGKEVWAYGGTSHLGGLRAEITRVWPGDPTLVYHHEAWVWSEPIPLMQQPTGPISQLLEVGGRVLAVVFGDLFESDHTLSKWQWRARFEAIRAVDATNDSLVLTTQRDGLVEYAGGRRVGHALPDQLPLTPFYAVASNDDLVLIGRGRDSVLVLRDSAWVPAASALPAPTPLAEADASAAVSHRCPPEFFRNPDGTIGVIARQGDGVQCEIENNDEDVVISGVWHKGKLQERSRELTHFIPKSAFALSDGTPAASSYNSLWMLERGKFRPHPLPEWIPGTSLSSVHHIDEHLGEYGPGSLVLARGALFRQRFSASRDPLFDLVSGGIGIFDAVRPSENEVIVATEHGLAVFDLRSAQLHPLSGAAPSDRIEALEADARGRIWGLGERLYLLSAAGAVAFDLPFVRPMPPRNSFRPRALSVAGRRIIIPLHQRGVLVLDADATARAAQSP